MLLESGGEGDNKAAVELRASSPGLQPSSPPLPHCLSDLLSALQVM